MSAGSLKKEIGFLGAVAYGVGIIVGAGIYALIGKAAGHAGNTVWASFILAGTVAAFTALSYGELTSMFPASAAEYVYIQKAFRSDFWAFIIGWLVLLSGAISGSTVALGFGGYLRAFIGLPEASTAIFLIILLALLNLWGIKKTVQANVVMTLIEIIGLVLVILFGVKFLGSVNYLEAPSGLGGVVTAAALIFFAFIGFESLTKIAEETKNPKRTIPRALILALAISTILFILVSLSVISVVPYNQLAVSSSPLTDVAMTAQGPQAALILSAIALVATANTVLITLTATSRMAYGMAKESSLPNIIARVLKRRGTPWVAILLITAASLPFVLLGDIELVANVTNVMIFLVFLAVNLALIILSRNRTGDKEAFKSPFRVKNVPVTAILGATSSFLMLLQFDLLVVVISALVIGLGGIIYKIHRSRSDLPCS